MTNLIYRGVKHDGHRSTAPRKPQKLIYRGVLHDGLSKVAEPARQSQVEMCYRGIRYALGEDGVVAGSADTFLAGLLVQIAS